MTEISPAILTNDISDFRKQYAELFALSHQFSKLHVDFCDGEFVKTKTLMSKDLKTVLSASPFTLIAHLMVLNPQNYFLEARAAGFKWVLFHYEAFEDDTQIREAINFADGISLRPGLVINPATPVNKVAKFITTMGLFQIMGIQPGAQGRQFIPETLAKIKELRSLSKNAIIVVDGGVRVGVAHQCMKAGANILVAGSAIVQSEEKEMAVESLKLDIEAT